LIARQRDLSRTPQYHANIVWPSRSEIARGHVEDAD